MIVSFITMQPFFLFQKSNASLLQGLNITNVTNSTTQKRTMPFGISLHSIFTWLTDNHGIDLTTVFNVVKQNIGTLMSVWNFLALVSNLSRKTVTCMQAYNYIMWRRSGWEFSCVNHTKPLKFVDMSVDRLNLKRFKYGKEYNTERS